MVVLKLQPPAYFFLSKCKMNFVIYPKYHIWAILATCKNIFVN